jgi:hypothetical protein
LSVAAKENPRRLAGRAGASDWGALYNQAKSSKGRFVKERLPEPLAYYAGQGIELRGRGVWRDAVCPFHQDARPSMRVHAETGAFRCMACGASGGDVLSFHRRRHVLGFVEAAQALGAWEDAP